ncbi:MAG TPA: GGDEF domain-containing protein [Rubrivivax sp.]|nr:GGDEF domain-containing protein [Burkholderiales bacterium]HNT38791.1 GGDEF domain-containing protein [Rubrivivax sp.]
MESGTIAVVLALTLACTGGMFLVIAKQMQGRSGMATFALGLSLFGLVFAVPAPIDAAAGLVLGTLIDAAAVAAVLLLRRGLQRFMREDELSWRALGLFVLGFGAVSVAARLAFGDAARGVVLLLVLALLFGWLAYTAMREAHRDSPLLRMPLLLLAAVLSALALLSLGNMVQKVSAGADMTGAVSDPFYDAVLMLAALLLGPTLLWMHSLQLTRQLAELATRDPLTRLLNEAGLDEALRRHFARRQHDPMTLMHIDVDRFERVNRLHGEAAGDDVLRLIGVALESTLRADDFVARVGGEEFVVASVGDDIEKAAILGERLRAAVAALQTGLSDGSGHLRCAITVGLSRPFADLERWRVAWDEAAVSMQAGKDAGGNCVVHPTN